MRDIWVPTKTLKKMTLVFPKEGVLVERATALRVGSPPQKKMR